MLSCLAPSSSRFGQEDNIINQSMPSSPAFSMQFPSLASSLHHHQQHNIKTSNTDIIDRNSNNPTTTLDVNSASADYMVKCPQCPMPFTDFRILSAHIASEHPHDKLNFENMPPHCNLGEQEETQARREHENVSKNNNISHADNADSQEERHHHHNNNNSEIKDHNTNNSITLNASEKTLHLSHENILDRTSPTNHPQSSRPSTPRSPMQAIGTDLSIAFSQLHGTSASGHQHHGSLPVHLSHNLHSAAAAQIMAAAFALSTGPQTQSNGGSISSGGSTSAYEVEVARSSSSPGSLPDLGSPYQCIQCTATFSSREQLDRHELLHSPNAQSQTQTQTCKICHKTFANVYRLQRHMISHDESALLRKFKCSQCDKAFKFKHHLKEHVRIHSGEKPFGCDNCGKRFSHSGSFSSHMTSKKCISMGLKLKLKTVEKNNTINKDVHQQQQQQNKHQSLLPTGALNGPNLPVDNNLSTTPTLPNPMNYFAGDTVTNGSTTAPFYQNLLPKYNDYNAMNAAIFAAFPHPFYNMALDPRMHSYNFQRLLELTAAGQQEQNNDSEQNVNVALMEIDHGDEESPDDPKLVMDLDECEQAEEKHIPQETTPEKNSPQKSLTPVEKLQTKTTDDAEDTKPSKWEKSPLTTTTTDATLYSTNIKTENDERDPAFNETEATCTSTSILSPLSTHSTELRCSRCEKQFNHPTELVQHEKVLCGLIKQELLEQQYQQQHQFRLNESHDQVSLNSSTFLQSGSDAEDEQDDQNSESRNDSNSEACGMERKVRVRTAINEEQQQQLKQHYAVNARPSREEFRVIANRLQLDPRVIQVWFQNNRSRERKLQTFQSSSNKTALPTKVTSASTPKTLDEQPLDLSVKRDTSTPKHTTQQHSPLHGIVPQQINVNNDFNEAINLSRKLSRTSVSLSPTSLSPTSAASGPNAFKQQAAAAAAAALYFGTQPSHNLRQTPSPNDTTPMAAQPTHSSTPRSNNYPAFSNLPPYMLPGATVAMQRSLVPMEALFQMTPTEYARSPLISSIKLGTAPGSSISDYRGTSLSPGGSEKRSWRDDDSRISHEEDYSTTAAATAASGLLPTKPKRIKETHGHAGDPDLPFICDQCDKAFAKQSSLARHKYEHSGQRPYQCMDCPKAFKHKHHLTEHKRLHSGEKPFQCSKCLKRFSHSGSYSQHMNHRYSYCKPYRE